MQRIEAEAEEKGRVEECGDKEWRTGLLLSGELNLN